MAQSSPSGPSVAGQTHGSPHRRVMVIETNEIPRCVLDWYRQVRPRSFLARFLRHASLRETQVFPEADRELYPSQTWATLATGVPFEKHGVYWYGDPKPLEYPLYWQHAARHRSVGVVGTLHSSPLSEQGDQPGLRFALPDPFASDADALPRSLVPLQRFNLAMTKANSRAVANRFPVGDYLRGAAAMPGVGLRPATAARLGRLVVGVATGRVPRERLRTGQFLLLADVFRRLVDDHDPDLSVLFTNHVAAAMHRYWPASFPDDWPDHPYDQEWINRFDGEIPFAVDALDRFLSDAWQQCRATDRILILMSSMGQEGGGEVDQGGPTALVMDDGHRFARRLGVDGRFRTLQAMAPHLTMEFELADEADDAETRLAGLQLDGNPLVVHRADRTITVTYHLGTDAERVLVNGQAIAPPDLGLRPVAVQEHKAGRHTPYGVLVWGDPRSSSRVETGEPIDLVEVAPAMLAALGVPPLDHHRQPSISLS